jgi:hypothetical protein
VLYVDQRVKFSGHLIQEDIEDEEAELRATNGICNILNGSEEFFAVMFGDKGYNFQTPRLNNDNISN